MLLGLVVGLRGGEAEEVFLKHCEQRRFAEASTLALTQVRSEPTSTLWWSYLGAAAQLQGRSGLAVEAFVRVRALGGQLERSHLGLLIDACIATSLHRWAAELKAEAIQRFPYSRMVEEEGPRAQAIRRGIILQATPESVAQLRAQALAAEEAGMSGLVLATGRCYLAVQAQVGGERDALPSMRLTIAGAALALGDLDEAQRQLAALPAAWRPNAVAFQRGRLALRRGDTAAARALLEPLAARCPDLQMRARSRALLAELDAAPARSTTAARPIRP